MNKEKLRKESKEEWDRIAEEVCLCKVFKVEGPDKEMANDFAKIIGKLACKKHKE